MSEITTLKPRLVWELFDAITKVPRPSKREGKIIEWRSPRSTGSNTGKTPLATW